MTGFTRRDKLIGMMVFVALLLFASSLMFVSPGTQPVQAAVITPVAQTARGDSRIAQFFVNETITADTRKCFDLAEYEVMDLQFQVDATSANTATITMQQTNIDPTAGPFNSGQAVATVIAGDANTMLQTGLFGKWNCVFIDVTNANTVTYTIIGVAK